MLWSYSVLVGVWSTNMNLQVRAIRNPLYTRANPHLPSVSSWVVRRLVDYPFVSVANLFWASPVIP
jgi:hypothetical protein